jgi:protein involved in polysaccharide export with SLBB domain
MKPFNLPAMRFLLCLLLSFLSSAVAQGQTDHRLAPGDTVVVKVYQEQDLDNSAVLGKDGTISLHLAGAINLAGLTAAEAAKAIEAAYRDRKFLVKPSVTVAIGIVKKRFSVQGQVMKPGPYFFPDGERVTLLQAVGFAGGYTRIANASKVTILRGSRTIKVDAKKLAKVGGETIYLEPGDVVNVPEGW